MSIKEIEKSPKQYYKVLNVQIENQDLRIHFQDKKK